MTKHPAAWINTIAARRDFDEAISYLQDTWDDLRDCKKQYDVMFGKMTKAGEDIILLKKENYELRNRRD